MAASQTFETPFVEEIDLGGPVVKFFCPNKRSASRATTVLTKKPEVTAWLDAMEPGSVLWDIGANIGAYTLYAATVKRCTVVAFEPSAANYFVINRNIELNKLQHIARALCIAVGAGLHIDHLYLSSTDYAEAFSNFGGAVDFQGNSFDATYRQGCVSFSLDDLVKTDLPFPNYIKVDVDGLESDIVEAGTGVLSDTRLQSVIVELDVGRPKLVEKAIATLRRCGLAMEGSTEPLRGRLVINAAFRRI